MGLLSKYEEWKLLKEFVGRSHRSSFNRLSTFVVQGDEMVEPKKKFLLELIKAMETLGGKVPDKLKLSLKEAYEKKDLNTLIKCIKEYIERITPIYSLYKKLKINSKELEETNPTSEAATCEFLISPVLKAVMKEEYRPKDVFIPSRANNAEIRADYILKGRVLIEAKNLGTEISDTSLNFKKVVKKTKEHIQNAQGNHLSQAVCYFVEIKHEKNKYPALQHLILTNGKIWFLVENIDYQLTYSSETEKETKISCKTREDLLKLTGKKLSGKFFNLMNWEDFLALIQKLQQLLH